MKTSDRSISHPAHPSGHPATSRADLKLAVFDFDGTLSWLRHGWPGMMSEVFIDHVPRLKGESEDSIAALLLDEILALNGLPSIRQCERVAELIRERGGITLDPEEKRMEFQATLDAAIERRSASISSGIAAPDQYLIHGARAFLERISRTDLTLVILSSTIQNRVIAESALLGIDHFFDGNIYGGTADPARFSKRAVFEQLLVEHDISGAQMIAFGDGPTEIRDATELGGVAIAVCSDEEHNGSGIFDERKRRQLHAAGAQASIPDYRDAGAVLDSLVR